MDDEEEPETPGWPDVVVIHDEEQANDADLPLGVMDIHTFGKTLDEWFVEIFIH